MLKSLEVKNFAIIDNIHLDFHPGMTVLTGETGAGKSIIVDAISLLLGERAYKEMINSKAETAEITGVFQVNSKEINNVLFINNLEDAETLTINRIISKNNNNLVKINNQNASLKVLKELALYLADIHSQFDTNQLVNPDNYLNLVDSFRKMRIQPLLDNYTELLSKYKERIKEYNLIIRKKEETLKKLDLYKFQYQELLNLKLEDGEYQEKTEKINILENIDKINTMLEKSKYYLKDEMVLDKIYEIKADFQALSKYSGELEALHERLNNIYYELDDIFQTINDKLDSLDYTKSDYEALIERINDLDKVMKKYQMSIPELIAYLEFLTEEINTVENYDDIIKEKYIAVETAYQELLQSAKNLSNFRKDIAQKITSEIVQTLIELVINNAQFQIDINEILPENLFDQSAFKSDGINQVEFLISTNKGEPLKPLAKTASGGEMSRVMLAFKTIFAKSLKIPTIIFDEIDTGISGYIAKQIARKIKELSTIAQVISITHIPQVVAEGSNHLAIFKKVVGNSTKIEVRYLQHEERIMEIAKMLSGDQVTEAAKVTAKELLINL